MKLKLNPAEAVQAYCRQKGYPEPDAEVRFHPGRKFAFDLGWTAELVALEFEGGLFGKGKPCPVCKRRAVAGHSSIQRIKSDMEKYNLAAIGGWRLVRVTPEQVANGEVFSWLDALFGG